jgi:adenylate cyclase
MHETLFDKTVLVVDDMSTIRTIISGFLGRNGMRVLEASSAEQGLQMARDHRVDAFLLDVQLPGMNGLELCAAIRSMEQHRSTPIIFITSLEQQDALQGVLEAGGDDFIHKPIDAVVLQARLRNLLQKTSYLRQVEMMGLSLQRYVSPRTEQIARAYATTGNLPAPRQLEVCVLFSDVRGFTETSLEMDPELLFDLLSEHLAAQVDLVYRHGGYVDKFAGDGMMAVFDGEDMALKSCLCALDILDASKDLIARRNSKIHQLGMGIHKGPAIIGNLGSQEHLDYTLIGKTVNLAARLCGMADLTVVVSEAVRGAIEGEVRLRFQAERKAAIRGYRQPISVFEVVRA